MTQVIHILHPLGSRDSSGVNIILERDLFTQESWYVDASVGADWLRTPLVDGQLTEDNCNAINGEWDFATGTCSPVVRDDGSEVEMLIISPWDFTNIWQIDSDVNNGYPTLR